MGVSYVLLFIGLFYVRSSLYSMCLFVAIYVPSLLYRPIWSILCIAPQLIGKLLTRVIILSVFKCQQCDHCKHYLPPPPPSIVYEIGCHLSAISNYFYSHNHSAVNISESHALLDNCIFKKNCLLEVEAGSWVSVRDYKFNPLHNILQQMLEGLFMPLFNLTFHAFTSPGIERLLYLNLKTIRKETK